MPITHMMKSVFNMIFLALTPIERWEAARQHSSGFSQHWFIVFATAALIIMTVVLLVVSYNRIIRERKISSQLFFDYAEQRGLSGRERQILLKVAHKVGLRRKQAIFSMVSAFDAGAKKMIQECLAEQGAEESKWLRTELSFLREKLGFQKKTSESIVSRSKLKRPSSRHILTGKKIYITRRKSPDLGEIESTVIKNDNIELTIKLSTPVEGKLGELWRARYSFGSSVWEFDSSAVRCNDNILVLNHSDDIRFISRRRFLRVQVNKPAFIAHFPFSRTLLSNKNDNKKYSRIKKSSANESDNWEPPKFTPAKVIEIGGPGLLIETKLEVKVGNRVLLIVNLSEEEKKQDSQPSSKSSSLRSVIKLNKKNTSSKIIEDIGEVRQVKTKYNGFLIAVELTGLSDSNLNELIRITNAAYQRANKNNKDSPDFLEAEEIVWAPSIVQGD